MRVQIDNSKECIINNNLVSLNNWWKDATADIYRNDRLIYCVEIDNHSLFNNYESYLVNNCEEINELNIKTYSREQSIKETCDSLNVYITRFEPASVAIADYFYGEVSEEQWSQFTSFLEGLNWIVQSIDFLIKLGNNEEPFLELEFSELENIIVEMEQNIERNDYVSVGDIIRYELLPKINNITEIINKRLEI